MAQPVDFVSQRVTLGDLPSEPVAAGAVAGQSQVPVGPMGDHPLGRVQQVGQSLLRVETADVERQVGVVRDTDRRRVAQAPRDQKERGRFRWG